MSVLFQLTLHAEQLHEIPIQNFSPSNCRKAGQIENNTFGRGPTVIFLLGPLITIASVWTVPQLSFMIIYYSTWSILIQWIRAILSGDNLT